MAYQLSTIRTKVQNRIKDSGFSTTIITDFINDVQRDIFNDYRLSFMETTQNYTLVSGVSDITNGSGLPANFDQAIALVVTTNGQEKFINYRSIREILLNHPDPSAVANGVPQYWYVYGDDIKVFPAPDAGYTVTLYYVKKPTELANDSDVPEIPSNFEELLVYGAAYRIMEVKDNYDKAAVLEAKYITKLDQLVVRYGIRQSGRATGMRLNRQRVSQGIN